MQAHEKSPRKIAEILTRIEREGKWHAARVEKERRTVHHSGTGTFLMLLIEEGWLAGRD
jgi:hypothetical protein